MQSTIQPTGENDFKKWELKVLLAVNGEGVSAERLGVLFGKDKQAVLEKANKQGVSLSTRGRK